MRNLIRLASLAAVVGLASVASAQSNDAAPNLPVLNPAGPAQGNGSYLALGTDHFNFPAETLTVPPDNGLLGIEAAFDSFYVSGRASTSPPSKIWHFDSNGVFIAGYPQTLGLGSSWGHRDMCSDEVPGGLGTRLWGGHENSWHVEYPVGPGGVLGAGAGVTIANYIPGTVRAHAIDHATAGSPTPTFFASNWGSTIHPFDRVVGAGAGITGPGLSFYGFCMDPVDNDKVWGHSQSGPGGTGLEWVEMSQATLWTQTGLAFMGTGAVPGTTPIAGGGDIFSVSQMPSNTWDPGLAVYYFAGAHQGTPDDVHVYESLIPDGTPTTTFCTAKTALVCGPGFISATGTASATATSGFVVSVAPGRGCREGVYMYNTAQTVPGLPFQGGTLCVTAMGIRRGARVPSNGTAPSVCDGNFQMDFNSFRAGLWGAMCTNCGAPCPGQTTPDAFLSVPGTDVYCQLWYRDSPATGSGVSDGIKWTQGS